MEERERKGVLGRVWMRAEPALDPPVEVIEDARNEGVEGPFMLCLA